MTRRDRGGPHARRPDGAEASTSRLRAGIWRSWKRVRTRVWRPPVGVRASRRRIVLAGLGVAATAGIAVWYVVIPYPWTLATRNPERTALIEQRLREADAAGASLELRHEWRRLGDISPDLVRAVLVAEDYRFRQHRGIDWVSLAEEVGWSGDGQFSWWSPSDLRALARAVAYTWSNRHEIRGRSTITQQLAKNLFYKMWLDDRMVYTCAYFEHPDATLEEAQLSKLDHVCRKLQLQPGQKVIEAGCGWGALAMHMAGQYGVDVVAYNNCSFH